MRLKLLLPGEVLVDEEVVSVTGVAPDGTFTLLPGHIDFVSALVPGILSFRAVATGRDGEAGAESFVAVDDGILVKKGAQVLVSTRQGVWSTDLGELEQTVVEAFERRDRRERQARTILARLESTFMDRFVELQR